MRARQVVYYQKHHKEILARKAAQRRNNPNKRKEENLKAKYGVTLQWYNGQLAAQGGKCAICAVSASECKKPLGVDHNHITGLVRGLLCSKCNAGIGSLQESRKILLKALEYLEDYESLRV